MDLAKRGSDPVVGKAAQEAGRRGRSSRGPERFDEQHFQQAHQDKVPSRPSRSRFVADEFHDRGQASVATIMDEPREQRDEQLRVGGSEHAIADQRTEIEVSGRVAHPDFATWKHGIGGLDDCRRWQQARHREVTRGGDQDEVAGLEHDRVVLFGRQAARSLQDRAIKRTSGFGALHGPMSARADDFRERCPWLYEGDHLDERI